jgi:protein-L-isoaspartate(D-aspartate) O-methyltransferase
MRCLLAALLVVVLSARGQNAMADTDEDYTAARQRMVEMQIASRDVSDPAVLDALRTVPRHLFVPARTRSVAYSDYPLPIGHGQTISQPYIVAKMTELARVRSGSKVLEIGTGSGYQAAVLAALGCQVYSLEIVAELSHNAQELLSSLGYRAIQFRVGDGYAGWPEQAPFDAIIVTAAPPEVPAALKTQLRVGGRLVIPVGSVFQELVVITRTETGFSSEHIFGVRFVPMVNKAGGN